MNTPSRRCLPPDRLGPRRRRRRRPAQRKDRPRRHGRPRPRQGLLRGFSAFDDVEIAYVCDPDENVMPAALKAMHRAAEARRRRSRKDIRKALDDKAVDAVVVAAPDHWHALATVWACQAGKHVYVEKPVSHNLVEGRRMVEAARKYNRVVQVGTQRRSAAHLAERRRVRRAPASSARCRSPAPGSPATARASARRPTARSPAGVDYDLWLGPAPERPFNPNRFHYNWHWNWDYGTGEMGNNGIHGLDVVRMVPGLDAPTRVSSRRRQVLLRRRPADARHAESSPSTSRHGRSSWEHRIWSKTGVRKASGFGVILVRREGHAGLRQQGLARRATASEASDKATGHREAAPAQLPRLRPRAASGPTPTSRRGTRARGCATWATSPTASAGRSASTPPRKRSPATPRRTECWAGRTARGSRCRTECDGRSPIFAPEASRPLTRPSRTRYVSMRP